MMATSIGNDIKDLIFWHPNYSEIQKGSQVEGFCVMNHLFVKSSPSVNLKCIFQAYLVSKFCNPGMFYFEDIWYSEAQGKFSNCQSNLFCQQSECNFSNFTVLHSVRKGFHFKTNLRLFIKKITSLQTQKICGCAHNSTSWFPSCNWIYKISKQFFPSFPLLTSYPFLLWYLLLLCVCMWLNLLLAPRS